MTREIGIRDLKNQASQIVHTIREERVEYVVTVRGEPVAVIRPFTPDDAEQQWQAAIEEEILDMQYLGEEIAAAWVSPKSVVELVEEQRR